MDRQDIGIALTGIGIVLLGGAVGMVWGLPGAVAYAGVLFAAIGIALGAKQ